MDNWMEAVARPSIHRCPRSLTHRVIWKYAAVLDAVHVALDLALQIGHAPAPVNGRREKEAEQGIRKNVKGNEKE